MASPTRLGVLLTTLCVLLPACRPTGGVPTPPDTAGPPDPTETGAPDPAPTVWFTPDPPLPGQPVTVHYAGFLAPREPLTVRYGFDGWNEVEGAPAVTAHGDRANLDWYADAPLTPGEDGAWEATFDVPDVRALHVEFYLEEGDAWIWDDNFRQGHGRAVSTWPLVGPYLTWSSSTPPPEGVVVHLHTGKRSEVTVEWGTTDDLGNTTAGSGAAELHHIPLTGLSPGTRYHYRVRDEDGHTSPTWSFETPSADPTELSFAVLSDIQDNGDDPWWSRTVTHLVENPDLADFLVLAGDLTNTDEPRSWWVFFDRARDLFASRVIVPAPGNHDTPDPSTGTSVDDFETWFPPTGDTGLPATGRLDLGLASFLTFNSDDEASFAEDGAATAWASTQVADLGDVPWVFAAWHVPPYNCGERHAREQEAVRPLTASFEGVVDWVFTGHEHLYQRTFPLRYDGILAEGGYGDGANDGVGYIVLPPGASHPEDRLVSRPPEVENRRWLAWPVVEPGVPFAPSEVGFVTVHLSAEDITLETWGMGTYDAPVDAHVIEVVSYDR